MVVGIQILDRIENKVAKIEQKDCVNNHKIPQNGKE